MAKYRFRKDTGMMAMLDSVGEYGSTREDTLKESDEWSAAWRNIDPDWNPLASNTLADFAALKAECAAELKILTGLKSGARKAGIDLSSQLGEIEDLSVSWCGVATRAFPMGTPVRRFSALANPDFRERRSGESRSSSADTKRGI